MSVSSTLSFRRDSHAEEHAKEIAAQADGQARIVLMENAGVMRMPDAAQFPCQAALGGSGPVSLTPGVSISHADGPAGSLGLFVSHNQGTMLLSCAHVLAPNTQAARRDLIHHPAGDDVSVMLNEHEIGRLFAYSKFNKAKANILDAGLAIVDEQSLAVPVRNVIPRGVKAAAEGKAIKAIATLEEIQTGYLAQRRVAKVGRTTGGTTGAVSALHKLFPLSVRGVIYEFQDILEIEWTDGDFARPGDSGGLVYDPTGMTALGLHFASSVYIEGKKKRTVSFACLLHHVLKTWQVELLEP